MGEYLYRESLKSWEEGQNKLKAIIQKHHPDYKFKQDFLDLQTKVGNVDAASWFRASGQITAAISEENLRLRIKAALNGAIKRGETVKSFYQNLSKSFDKYKQYELKQLELTYDTQMSLAFGASQQAKLLELSEDFPYWRYSALMDSRTRPSHAQLNGKVFKATDQQFYPPIGFRCRCTAIPMTARQMKNFPGGLAENIDRNKIKNDEFVGNKQKQFAKWVEKRYKKADDFTKAIITKAVKEMLNRDKRSKLDEIKKSRKATKEFANKYLVGKTFQLDDFSLTLTKSDLKNLLSHGHSNPLAVHKMIMDIENTLKKSTFIKSKPKNKGDENTKMWHYYKIKKNFYLNIRELISGEYKLYSISNVIK